MDDSLTINKELNNIYESLKIIEEDGHRKLVVTSDLEPWTTSIRISFKDIMNLEEVTTIPLDKMNPDMLDIIANRYDWRNDPYIGYNNNPHNYECCCSKNKKKRRLRTLGKP